VVDLPLTGGCLCGRVRFEVTRPLRSAGYCHCTRCQRRTGTAASPQARVEPGSLVITAGEDLITTYEPPDGFAKLFCSSCGSALFSRSPDDSSVMSVRLGAFDDDPGIRPTYRQWLERAVPWEPVDDGDGLLHFPGPRPADIGT
jgi:hypothetical protein